MALRPQPHPSSYNGTCVALARFFLEFFRRPKVLALAPLSGRGSAADVGLRLRDPDCDQSGGMVNNR